MIGALRRRLAGSPIFAFNPVLRDRFVAAEAARLPRGTRILDVGAGSCPYRPLFAHCEYRSQDPKPLVGEQLRHGAYGTIDYVSDATAIPVPDASFDAVLCTEMLEHHPHPIDVVREFARVLAPGGRLLLTAPLGSGIHQEPYHFYGGYTPFWYRKFLGEAGFDSIEIVPNGGSARFFGQEAIRFLRATGPHARDLPLGLRLAWLPAWLCLVPLIGILVPLVAPVFDRFEREPRFTVGYHVTARRAERRS